MTWKKLFFVPFFVTVVLLGPGFRAWNSPPSLPPTEELSDLARHPADSQKLFAAAENSVYLRAGKEKWGRLFTLPRKSPIKKLAVHPKEPNKIFLLTEDRLWEGGLGKVRWTPLFDGIRTSRIHSFSIHPENPERLFVAAGEGLFQSGDGGRTWLRPYRWPENQPAEFVAAFPSSPSLVLLGTGRELFFSKDGGLSFESGFSLPFSIEETFEESEAESVLPEPRFRAAAISPMDFKEISVATSEGIYQSEDGGINWARVTDRGLEARGVRDLLYSPLSGQLIALAGRSVVRFHGTEKRWETLPLHLNRSPAALEIRPAEEGKQELLLIASGNEVFEFPLSPFEIPFSEDPFLPSPERGELFRKLLLLEPTIQEVHQAAIRYGNLSHGRLQRWHWGSRLRALLPRVGFGKDFSSSANVDIDRGGTGDPDKFIRGPDDLDEGWDLNLTWELGDLIWSTAQPAIDSRTKLLVELRESLLSEVTRLYFERRRLQMEIAFSGAETPQASLERLLRLDEFTAHLDALTNGFFSNELRKIYRNSPELSQLWDLFGDRHL